ncbi:MAG TPA: head decoration protein [Pirellulales bacterium]|nr:head decoration protein [Pirellulales bacterium]
MSALPTMGNLPGFSTLQQTVESVVTWGGDGAPVVEQESYVIDSTTVDSGNSPTTYLRPGLLLGKIASSGNLKQYSATASDGSQNVFGVLLRGISTLDLNGNAENKYGKILVGGCVKGSLLIGLDQYARRQMVGRFFFDDDFTGQAGAFAAPYAEVAKTAAYQVLATDNGTLFTTLGASAEVDFTLPAIAAGYTFQFLNLVAQTMKVLSNEGSNIVWDNNASASSLAFGTASHQIGGHLQFYANGAGTKWYVRNYSPATSTVTAA